MTVSTPNREPALSASEPAWRRFVPQGRFFQNVLRLAGATAVGYALTILASPLLTRLYEPADFKLLAVYMSLASLATSLACWRYDIALPLPSADADAADLVFVCLILAVCQTALLSAALFFWGGDLAALVNAPELAPYLWMLPPGILSLGLINIFNYWVVRRKTFGVLGVSEIARRGTETSVQIGLGMLALGPAGLLVGGFLSQLSGGGVLACSMLRRDRGVFRNVSLRGIRRVAVDYGHYPLFAAPAALVGSAGLNLPPMVMAACFAPEAVGWFLLSQRVVGLPMTFVGKAISHVYFGEAAQRIREQPQTLYRLYSKATAKLALIAVPVACAALFAPEAFAFVFGENWREAGRYCRLLAVPFAVQFVVLSITQLTTYGVNHWQLGWEVFRLPATVGPLLAAWYFERTPAEAVAWYGIGAGVSFALLYVLNLLAIRRLVGVRGQGSGVRD